MEHLTWIGKTILSAAISWLTGQVLGSIKNRLPAIRHFFERRTRKK